MGKSLGCGSMGTVDPLGAGQAGEFRTRERISGACKGERKAGNGSTAHVNEKWMVCKTSVFQY